MCLAQEPQCSDAGEAGTRDLLVSSQTLYHCAPLKKIFNGVLPYMGVVAILDINMLMGDSNMSDLG